MNRSHRLSPELCIDCERAISDRAVRCRFCASRAREGLPPAPVAESRPEHAADLTPEVVAWLRDQGYRYNPARLALRFDVPVGRIRAVLDGTGDG